MCTDCYKNSSKEIQKSSRNVLCPVTEIDLHCQNKVKIFKRNNNTRNSYIDFIFSYVSQKKK
jgi:hypothetical protein